MYRGSQSTQLARDLAALAGDPEQALVYLASAVRDAAGVNACPGAVAIRAGRIVAAGPIQPVLAAAGPNARQIDLHHRLLIPGLVNAHTHLDLTGVGYRPYGGDFVRWIKGIIDYRMAGYLPSAAIANGGRLSYDAGVLTVGDIGPMFGSEWLRETGLRGVQYCELLGAGEDENGNAWDIEEAVGGWATDAEETVIRKGLQPHAPYSAGPAMFRQALTVAKRHGLSLSTHLAETLEERRFVAEGGGPLRRLLEEMNKWGILHEKWYGRGRHPVEWLFEVGDEATRKGVWLCAHCNYVDEVHIRLLAENGASVAYCPRASEYFGHRDHRYRDMLAAGVNVCLGTDSIICHPDAASGLSILDEMRRLYQRDRTPPELLLKMATVNGMRGLGLDEKDATFAPGANPGVVGIRYDARPGVDPLEQVLASEAPPQIEVLEGTGT